MRKFYVLPCIAFMIAICVEAQTPNSQTSANTGNIGIGTTTPLARLHVKDSSVIFTGYAVALPQFAGQPPVSGAGSRQFWYADKAAFRTGGVDNGPLGMDVFDLPDGTHYWDKDSIGQLSFAAGYNNMAKGIFSTASGAGNIASGISSVAMGAGNTASGGESVALGSANIVSGSDAFATGYHNISGGESSFASGVFNKASGSISTAMGQNANTNGHAGAFLIGDASGTGVTARNDNEFRTFFSGGYVLFTAAEGGTMKGATLLPGDVSWSSTSDSTKKAHFLKLDGEWILTKLGGFHSLGSWSFKGQDPKLFRHYGPMAQDFHQAFGKDGIGNSGNDTLINSADMNGILFIAMHALAKRTNTMIKKTAMQGGSIERLLAENQQLKADNQFIKEQYAKVSETLQTKLAVLEKQLKMLSLLVETKKAEWNEAMVR